jgi:hypothetical protein
MSVGHEEVQGIQKIQRARRVGRTALYGVGSEQRPQGLEALGRLVWYVIPAPVVLKTKSSALMLCPVQPMQRNCYRYECYREAWKLLRAGKRLSC